MKMYIIKQGKLYQNGVFIKKNYFSLQRNTN